MALKVGQPAPDFTVTAADGRELKLADFRGKKNVVLYFYPADFTAVCTKETCGFRDSYEDLASKDTEVIGVSVDDDASHRKFAEKYKVPFALVSDPQRALSEKFGATGGLLDLVMKKSRRITYVIDKQGVIKGVFQGELSADKHVKGAKGVIDSIGR
jgi:thioredoxin-dependent peroxiredoxin